jgi:hypothetical protein
MKRLDFYIDWYQKENERQISLNDSLNLPIGILTGLFAVIFFMLKEFTFSTETRMWVLSIFVILILAAVVCWIIVAYNLYMSYNRLHVGYEYKGIPYPTILNEQYDKLQTYVEENILKLGSSITKDSLFEAQLSEMISEYLNRNISNNDQKSMYLHISKRFLLICILFIILSSLPFFCNYIKYQDNKEITKVQVMNIPDLNKTNNLEYKYIKHHHHDSNHW